MRTFTGVVLSAVILVSTSGCAAIFTGSSQKVPVVTDPPGAEIRLDGEVLGISPAEVTIKRGSTRILQIVKEGYETTMVTLGTKFNGWFLGNVLLGGIIGIAVDIASGAWMWVSPEEVTVTLQEK